MVRLRNKVIVYWAEWICDWLFWLSGAVFAVRSFLHSAKWAPSFESYLLFMLILMNALRPLSTFDTRPPSISTEMAKGSMRCLGQEKTVCTIASGSTPNNISHLYFCWCTLHHKCQLLTLYVQYIPNNPSTFQFYFLANAFIWHHYESTFAGK